MTRTFFGGTIATADLGAMETCGDLLSFSPLIDLRKALNMRMTVSKQVENVGGESEANKTRSEVICARRSQRLKEGHREVLVSHRRHQKPKTVRKVLEVVTHGQEALSCQGREVLRIPVLCREKSATGR
jgi:hypothetical protein